MRKQLLLPYISLNMQFDSNDILSIQPDTWYNIPVPLKQAITLLAQHLSSHSEQLHQLFTQQETTNTGLTQLSADLTKCKDSVQEQREEMEGKLRISREEGQNKLELERKERLREAKEADRRSTEASTRLTSLINHYSAAISDLKSTQNSHKAAVRTEVEALLEPNLKIITENIEERSIIWQKSLQTLTNRVESVEELQRTSVMVRLEAVEKTAETALTAAKEHKAKETRLQEHSEAQVQATISPLKEDISLLCTEIKRVNEELAAAIAVVSAKMDSFHLNSSQKQEELLGLIDVRIQSASNTLSAASESAHKWLAESIKWVETGLKEELRAQLGALDCDLTGRMEQYVAWELKEVREKLAVRTI